jgi:hypothetical protein
MSDQGSFVNTFMALRDGVIRPVLEAIGQQLARQGHAYKIGEGIALSPPKPLALPYAGVALQVFPSDVNWETASQLPLLRIPTITFGVNLAHRKVDVFVDPNCEHGERTLRLRQWDTKTAALYDIDEVTPEIIKREVEEFFREIPLEIDV